MELRGKRALITGATGGLGGAIARRLADEGAHLVLTGRRQEVLDSVAAATGGQALVADLSSTDAVDALLADAGQIDLLVANAALPGTGELTSFTGEQIERAISVNLTANLRMTRVLAEGMIERGCGHIVIVGSIAGKAAIAGSAVYSATKYGLRGFALALRGDLRPAGVGVSLVEPGLVGDVGLFADTGVEPSPGMRTVSSDDVAQAVVDAVTQNRREVVVAPWEVRAFVAMAARFPDAVNAMTRRGPMARMHEQLVESQRHLR